MPDPSHLPSAEMQSQQQSQPQQPPQIDKAELALYERLKKEHRDMMTKKRILEKNVSIIEDQIFKFEGAYLEDTPNGNIIKGFDNYLKAGSSSSLHGGSNALKRRATYTDSDRLFSLSSCTYTKSLQKEAEVHEDSGTGRQNSVPPAASTSKQPNKKKKRKKDDHSSSDSDDSPAVSTLPKRLKLQVKGDD
ncbi:histone acetyltransferase subunit NuA4-domain-containing protein [Myxozyma melibiosi]|uniref:Chromatin modification-related protein EAF6 n=1 Tax=Myxozyma melibiosi TaxID=54550 RepID=A0ABR1EY96_9ASCO